MTKDETLALTERISRLIAEKAPYVDYTPNEVRDALDACTDKELSALIRDGYMTEDFELYYVVSRFAEHIGLSRYADGDYIRDVYAKARKFLPEELEKDAYMRTVKVPTARLGRFLLTNVPYARGEFFQYAMPNVWEKRVTPSLGFFTGDVLFPSIYEGDMPWVSVCPSEIFTMSEAVPHAFGRVLVLGLGLGYFPFRIAEKADVREIVIVERQREIIELFETHLLPQFPRKEKITVVRADAFDYLGKTPRGRFDYCYADIWENDVDGAACYRKIKPHAERLDTTRFEYWIEREILWRMEREKK